jgi:undecaprenyl-diphosphatase
MGQELLGVRIPGVGFEIAVHLATLLSVVLVFRRRLGALAAGAVKGDREAWRYLGLLALATVPAAAVGLTLEDRIDVLFESPAAVGAALLVTGSFLWTTRRAVARRPQGKPGVREALLVGTAQALALVPGISRSGSTVTAALWLGVEAEEAAAFSFLMAIPAILGAAVLKLPELTAGGGEGMGGALLLGSLVAAAVGVLAIRTFVALLQRRAFHRFGPYCWLVGGAFLVYLVVRG